MKGGAMANKSSDAVSLRPIGEAIEKAQQALQPFDKDEDVKDAIAALGCIHVLVKSVCHKTYGILPKPPKY
jgi:hypothetical protein